MFKTFISVAALASASVIIPSALAAQCVPSGTSVDCTGADADGFQTGDDNIDVTVRSGATVGPVAGDHAIEFDDDGSLTVEAGATIIGGSDDDGVNIDKRNTVVNAGQITSLGDDALQVGDDTTITNTGIIGGVLGTQIGAEDEGVNGEDGVTLDNLGDGVTGGIITAKDDAVKVGIGAVITNTGLIENVGTDPSDPQDAIDIDQGTIINSGTVRSTLDAAIDFDAGTLADSTISNSGLIQGTVAVETDPGNDSGQIVRNLSGGNLVGTSGKALNLGAASDLARLEAGSATTGDVDLGGDNDTLELGDVTGLSLTSVVFYGGDGTDDVDFFETMLSALTGASGTAADLTLAFAGPLAPVELRFVDFESFLFSDLTDEVSGQALLERNFGTPPAVPLPGGLWLALGGLGALGLLRRRDA